MEKIIVLFIIAGVSFLGIGWIMNLVEFVNLDFESPYKAEIIRGIGLSSYGAIIGWIDIKDN
jgi:hypothetical protein